MNIISNIIKQATISDAPKNILVFPYDTIYELLLCENSNHNYYLIKNSSKFGQPITKHPRMFWLDENPKTWPIYLDFDMVICNDITKQLEPAKGLANFLQIPLVIIFHGLPPDFVKLEDMQILSSITSHCNKISIDTLINKSWYANHKIVPYGIPSIEPKKMEDKILIVGNFAREHIEIVKYIINKSNKPVTLVGDNPGLSSQTDFNTCLELIQTHNIFLNLYNETDINLLMLYAMSAGCKVISTYSKINETIIKNGTTGFITRSVDEIVKHMNSSGENLTPQTIRQKLDIEAFKQNIKDKIIC